MTLANKINIYEDEAVSIINDLIKQTKESRKIVKKEKKE
jgi:hypothetical protein